MERGTKPLSRWCYVTAWVALLLVIAIGATACGAFRRGGRGDGGGVAAVEPPSSPVPAPPPPTSTAPPPTSTAPPPPTSTAPPPPTSTAPPPPTSRPTPAPAAARPRSRLAPRSEVEIFYGTNRARLSTCDRSRTVRWDTSGSCRPNTFYTGSQTHRDAGRVDELEVGSFKVAFPPGHQPGNIERPLSIFTIDLRREDPSRDVVISELSSFGTDYDAWVRAVKSTGKQEAFVFVHGYNTRFESAARQAGQLAFDLEIDRDFAGLPMLYSWPSQGTLEAYLLDYDISLAATQAFNHFLDLLKDSAGLSRIHIIAHSMGNWLVANALRERSLRGGTERLLEQLVLAAPDIPADGFRERFLKTLPQLARRVTLYVSDNDKALRASARFRTGIPRAGLLDGGLMSISEPRFDVVDATLLPADFLDHSYYATNHSMLADIYCLLHGSPADGRPLIVAAGVNWSFRPPSVLKDLKAATCGASREQPEARLVPPIQSPLAPPASGPALLWLTGLITVIVAVAGAYFIVRRRQRMS